MFTVSPEKNSTAIFNSFLQIHSLTARSVPRQVRENLRKDLPIDKNIRLPAGALPVGALPFLTNSNSKDTTPAPSSENECHVIYDSQHKEQVPYPKENAEFIRTPSPEHTGIPAGPVKMPPIRSWQSAATTGNGNGNNSSSNVGYTSDDSNASLEQPVKPVRRKASKQNSNPSVRSLVEKYSC